VETDVSAHPLAHLNALLNATAAVLLVIGYLRIRQGREVAHRRIMLTAFGVSIAFLVSYLSYHLGVLGAKVTHFSREGAVKTVYLSILTSHVVLAAIVPFLASITIYLGFRCQLRDRRGSVAPSAADLACRQRHRRLARVTLPIWLYVSVTGVVVYLMLYHLFPRR